MMALLLVIVIPLAALVIYAVVFDLRRRRRGTVRSHDISSAARAARADADARGASGLRPPDGGPTGAAGLSHGP
jgi:hypothetical protein